MAIRRLIPSLLLMQYHTQSEAEAAVMAINNTFAVALHTCDVLVRVPPTAMHDEDHGWRMRARFCFAPKLYAEGRMLTCDTAYFEETLPEVPNGL